MHTMWAKRISAGGGGSGGGGEGRGGDGAPPETHLWSIAAERRKAAVAARARASDFRAAKQSPEQSSPEQSEEDAEDAEEEEEEPIEIEIGDTTDTKGGHHKKRPAMEEAPAGKAPLRKKEKKMTVTKTKTSSPPDPPPLEVHRFHEG